MSLFVNRLLLTGAGLFAGVSVAAAAPYPTGHSGHSAHGFCADGACETSAHCDHAGHCPPGSECAPGMDGRADYYVHADMERRYRDSSPASTSSHFGSRWPEAAARGGMSDCEDCLGEHPHHHGAQGHAHHHPGDHGHAMRQDGALESRFMDGPRVNDRPSASWNQPRTFGDNPNRPGTYDYPRNQNFSRTPNPNAPFAGDAPRALPRRSHQDLLINQPTRW